MSWLQDDAAFGDFLTGAVNPHRSRRDNRTANGTLTLRRTSTNPFAASQQPSVETAATTPSSEVPQPSAIANYESQLDSRYSKNKLLDLYKSQSQPESTNGDVTRLYTNNWDPTQTSTSNGRGWGKLADTRDNSHGPDVCWDQSGQVQPIGLEEMSALEKSLFTGDVNSPMKPPPQNTNKDPNNQGSGANGKKNAAQGQLNSPSANRPGPRRRETSDSVPFSNNSISSPSGTGRFPRDEGGFASSPFFNRKANDFKDNSFPVGEDRGDDGTGRDVPKTSSPFAGLMRSNTGGTTLGNTATSPWGSGPPSVGLPTMGAFGSFALPTPSAQPGTPGEKRPNFGNMRGESRLAHLMPKESSEDIVSKAAEQSKGQERSWRTRPRTDTDPFGDEGSHSGSAALGGGQDVSPPLQAQHRAPGLDTPTRQVSSDLGMSDMPGFRDMMQQRREPSHQTPQGQHHGEREPLSPTETNPYASPPAAERDDHDDNASLGSSDIMHGSRLQTLGGIPEHAPNNFGGLPRGFGSGAFDGSDRSQTSSVGPGKGFPSLGGLGGLGGLGSLGGWPTSANASGTPGQERSGFQGAFGNSIFSPMGELQSPGLGAFGSGAAANISGNNAMGRGSKLGSLFPPAMQAQMHGADHDSQHDDQRQPSGFGAIGRGAFGIPPRDTESPMRTRNVFEDLFPSSANTPRDQQSAFFSGDGPQAQTSAPHLSSVAAPSGPPFSQGASQQTQPPQASSDTPSSQLPQTQQRTMVMPDRMRWVYLDPQGQTQGPWSGLEMHDWYKASFFTADLSVRKLEDAEFEPLGQLIRRIGNSREPFLVPQIGVPSRCTLRTRCYHSWSCTSTRLRSTTFCWCFPKLWYDSDRRATE
jgi:PERQ amino acid-rich with GYF domain-containing protein